ncbi:amino acid adenylation domain-containing protein, partial [Micromonospora chersina]|uniref:amino acid adenylation domain-containing protein n=1 Tax=Micromonospora chersina TaxID=47854 RepID=UPI00371E57EF
LTNHPAITHAIITKNNERLIAYLVCDHTPPTTQELQNHLHKTLPEHMIPSVFITLDALPLTGNGKLDRNALPAVDSSRPNLGNAYRAPATPAEEILASVWTDLLKLDRVGVTDNFFDLGGHSLLATQAVTRIRALFGVNLSVAAIFDRPTVAGLAELLAESGTGAQVPPIIATDRGRPLPLSFAQQRLWFVAQLDPESAEYNSPAAISFGGPFDAAALAAALTTIVERHEVLRTRLVGDADGVPHQVVDAPWPFELPLVDVSAEADPVATAKARAAEEARTPFDLAAGPLIRATLYRIADEHHLLALCLHHVVSDEWSTKILDRELGTLYRAYRDGQESPLPALPVQYADYAAWQHAWLTGDVLDAQLDYWRTRLADPPVLNLPTDRPRPPVRPTEGAALDFTIAAPLAEALRQLSKRHGVTMFMTLFAAYAVLLQRETGQDDLLVGTPIANRNQAEIEPLIGFFVNTLVLRARLDGNPTFAELLGQVRATALEAYAHQDLPFEQLVDDLVHERDRSRTPLIQTLFNYFTPEEYDTRPADGTVRDGVIAKFDLRLLVTETGDTLTAAVEYPVALFDHETVRRFAAHLMTLLAAVAADPDQPLSSLPLLTGTERAALAAWNDTALPGEPRPAHQVFADLAARQPDAPAVVGDGRQVSYSDLDAAANRLARHLRGLGIGAETVVGLCLNRGPELITAMLAVWKAGAAYLPLDPAYPTDRLAYMLTDSRAALLISTGEILDDLPAGRIRTLTIDDPAIARQDGTASAVTVHPEQAAYLIYTSGSTGRPKGVTVPHRGLSNLVTALRQLTGTGPGATTLQFASPSFDASVWEIAMALTSGATLAVACGDEQNDPALLAGLLREHAVSVVTLPPSLVRSLTADHLATVTTLITAGERLDPALAREWAPRLELINAYGPTETTVCATAGHVPPADSAAPPIGRPIANTTAHLLDRDLNPVPVGVTGELFVGGSSLARGYRGRPAMTAAAFIPNPLTADGSRLYRTGDLARRLPDGRLEYLGRADRQIKVRGRRIEPAEIETALGTHPEVDAAVVTAYGERLIAYVVCGDGMPPAATLRRYLGRTLPDFLIPELFIELAELPLNPNGKIDRSALPEPEADRQHPAGGYRAPGTATEEILAGIWAHLLHLDRVGVTDDFFDLGGHSLLATQAATRLRGAFGIDLPTAALFDHPTIEALGAVIDATAGARPAPAAIPRASRDGALPLSFAQRRLWFLDQLDPESTEYLVPHLVHLEQPVEPAAMVDALSRLVARHETLRTRLVTDADGIPHQVIDEPAPFPLDTVDLAADADPMATLRRPFDLGAGPLLRAALVRVTDGRQVLALCVHHAVFDDWSAGIFERELFALLRGETLPDLPIQYADYAAWANRQDLDAQLTYWRAQLADPPVLQLPADRPRPPIRSAAGATLRFTVAADLTAGLRELSRRSGTTMFMTLAAAYAVLLQRHTGQDDLIIGTPVANRDRAEVEPLIGLFVNTLALRTRLADDPTFTELLARTRATTLAAYRNQDLPFERLVDELLEARDRSQTPLVQTLFSYTISDEKPSAGAQPNTYLQTGTIAKVDLTFTVTDLGSGPLTAALVYATDLFDEATVRRLLGHLWTLLVEIVADPEQPVSRLAMLTGDERAALDRWNDTFLDVPARSVPELIAGQADERPTAVAVVCDGRTMTYAEIDAAANRLAHHLIAAGAGPEEIVGLHLDRGLDLIVSMLAVWKAGAAYLPLDPRYPAGRLRFMLADSGAHLVIGAAIGDEMVRYVDPTDPVIATRPDTAPGVPLLPGQAAYVIYTSGSTGRPKGVVVHHRGLATFAAALQHHVGTTAGDTTLQFASASFDASVWETVMALTAGATLVVATADEQSQPELLAALLQRHSVDVALLPPSLLDSVVPDRFGTLRTLISGGEPLGGRTARAWAAGRRLLNAYGPTETSVWATLAEVPAAVNGAPPIGHPIANTRIRLLDHRLREVPAGVTGEIYIAGESLARGYLGRAARTAAAFVPDPFSADGSRLYRTGDLARRLPDGQLDYLGRNDAQIKVRGHRIEPAEIQHRLEEHPTVRACVATARDRRLVAYLVPADPAAGMPAADMLREHLRGTLPEHMIPAAFVEITAVPLTPNGKTDLAALPEPSSIRPDLAARYRAPHGDVERQLAEIWAEVLRLDRVGADDNFFELGGDSILSIQAVAKARAAGLHLSPAQMFDHQTVAELASVVSTNAAEAEQGPIVGQFPLSPIQRWFFGRDLLDPAHFNQHVLLEAADRMDPRVLGTAIDALLRHHDGLRSRFFRDNLGLTAWVVAEESETPLRVVDADGLDDAALDSLATEAHTSLDLQQGPLIRFLLLDRRSSPQTLLIVAHHLVVDRVSWGILTEDLTTAYAQAETGRDIRLPSKTTSFQRWSQRLTELAASPETLSEMGYWREVEKTPAALPRDRDGVNTLDSTSAVSVVLDPRQTGRLLREVPAAYRTQINDALLAALGTVLTEWTGGPAVLVDLEGHGREDVGADIDVTRTVGWFTTFHPVTLTGGADPGETLRATKDRLRAVPRRGLGHGLLRHLTPLMRAGGQAEVSFNYLGQSSTGAAARFRPAGGPTGTPRSAAGERGHLIEISGNVQDGFLHLVWTFSRQVHDEATVRRLADRYLRVLSELIDHCCALTTPGHTPADFRIAGLGQAELDALRDRTRGELSDVYPLTPLQQGMLFHTELAPGSGVYWVQHGLSLTGPLDVPALRRAWDLVFDRHAVLRSTVVSAGLPSPMSVVSASVPLPLTMLDLSGENQETQQRRVAALLAEDRARGADFQEPTLVRIHLIRLAAERHQMVVGFHHLLLDGWSIPIVLGDLMAAYRAFSSGQQPPPVDRPPFRDHVAWTLAQDPAEAEAYWRERLAGLAEPTPLQLEPPAEGSGHHIERSRLSADTTRALDEVARRHRLTLNTLVQGAWATLLAAYAETDDVLFGVTTSGRGAQFDGVEQVVGLLINTIPCRVRVEHDRPAAEWLRDLQREQSRARTYEHTSLADIAGWSELPPGQRLFDTVLIFENYPGGRDGAGGPDTGLRVEQSFAKEQTGDPLTVVVGTGHDLGITMVYDGAQFEGETVRGLMDQLANLLTALATDPERPVGDLPILTPADHARLSRWNDTAAPNPLADGVHRAIPTHDGPAIVFGDGTVSYRDLDERANQLAHRLIELGAGPERVVALHLDRGPEMAVAMLGVLKAGAAYLPMDTGYPADRLRFMLTDSGADILVHDRTAVGDVPHRLAIGDPSVTAAPRTGPEVTVRPDQAAYVVYTSGSTGRPKGVVVTHRNLASAVGAQRRDLGMTSDDVALQNLSFGFDVAASEVWTALTAGARLVIADEATRRSIDDLQELMRSQGITVGQFPPSAVALLDPAALPDLRTVVVGGESCPSALARAWAGGRRLLNAYGPSETTICTAIAHLDGTDGTPPIGRPTANSRIHVLDARLRPAPIGVPGELYIGGDQVSRGYRGRPALTAERFVPDPFSTGGRLYRTGDVGRWLPDGRLAFLGRTDRQIKIRSHRIEPVEIETALTRHPRVGDAVVTAHQGRLVGYLVPDGSLPTGDQLREHLRLTLPEHMIPALYVEIASIPLNANGKRDLKALPAPDSGRPQLRTTFQEPLTATEQTLAGIWSELLGFDRIGATDNFFDLGGHSLLATRAIGRIRTTLGINLPLAALFDQPTIRTLANLIDTETNTSAAPIVPVDRSQKLPLSYAQQRLWFLAQLDPTSTEYHIPAMIPLDGDIDPTAVADALTAIVERHEVLRTRIVAGDDDHPYQVIDPPAPVPLPIADVTDGRDHGIRDNLVDAPFDLAAGPMLRAALLRVPGQRWVLALCLHHIVADEWSATILRDELTARLGSGPVPAPLPVQYADYAVWQREHLTGEVLDAQLDYWRTQLTDPPVLELPTDRPRPPVRSTDGAVATVDIPSHVTEAIRELSRRHGATMFMTLAAAYAVLLHRHTGQDDL